MCHHSKKGCLQRKSGAPEPQPTIFMIFRHKLQVIYIHTLQYVEMLSKGVSWCVCKRVNNESREGRWRGVQRLDKEEKAKKGE